VKRLVKRLALLAAVALLPWPARAQGAGAGQAPSQQERARLQREELDRIRRERADLERKARELRSTVHDLFEERTNLDRQADATARVVRTLDAQIVSLADEEADATSRLVAAQDELALKHAILRYRVREIYKRGPMYSVEAMLSAGSFGELLARYKYLHLVAIRDRTLVSRVAALGDEIAQQRQSLVRLRNNAEQSRADKADEERRLRSLEQQRGRSLAQAESQQKQVEARLAQVARDEARVASIIASLDEARRRSDARPGAAPPSSSSLRTSDLGRLDWPVDGAVLYRFGRQVNPNNTTIRWNGIGIGAASGTPVKSVSAGTVEYAERMGTYGLIVIVNHGGGDYSLYGSLGQARVAKGAKITKGQVIGTVGVSDPDIEPHLHFEIRPNGRAVDPLDWLRANR
jgi:septal ring factor EnvC (AmiA/AmiB activator)